MKITKYSIYGILGWIVASAFGITIGLACEENDSVNLDVLESENSENVDELIQTTVLCIKNENPVDCVLVYLTLNTGKMYVSDVNGIFGIKSSKKSQGSFYLAPEDSVSYVSPKGKAINGNVSFWSPPLNCPYVGTTLFEFNLNNYRTSRYAQETVDISCMAGVSCFGSIDMSGGLLSWTDNVHPESVTHIQNDSLYKNTGISGVFPYGCTNCTNTDGAPVCSDNQPAFATPNKQNICNVQRYAKGSGGSVTISYLKR